MTGAVAEPRGSQDYTGERIHCTHWDGRWELRGRRVAVVGDAAAVARVLPPVVARADKVTVFQQNPVWMLPRLPVAGLSAWLPARLARAAARANLRLQVRDPWVRRQLTPEDESGIRRHNHYYRALQRPNCHLVTWPIATLAPLGIRTADGIEHRVDCIVFAHSSARPHEREQP
ncbi:hypothetical protein [Nocardia veterana]|uniref:Uncharacterized protein n=1 Tax=Nocardia veterana TaxID=132249 RepID=A0A7X6RKE5_9NOCA|nr:hypothetical protein [Nocardia veterana]NKY89166.1 hypothetical protein [Nocardia veterana]